MLLGFILPRPIKAWIHLWDKALATGCRYSNWPPIGIHCVRIIGHSLSVIYAVNLIISMNVKTAGFLWTYLFCK